MTMKEELLKYLSLNKNLHEYITKENFFKLFTEILTIETDINVFEFVENIYDDKISEIICSSQNVENFIFMLKCGIDINYSNYGEYGSLFQIVLTNQENFETLKTYANLLITHGFNIYNYTTNDGGSNDNIIEIDKVYPNLLFYVTSYSCYKIKNLTEIILFLIKLGINPNVKNNHGNTILHLSVKDIFSNTQIINLLYLVVDNTIINNRGYIPTEYASELINADNYTLNYNNDEIIPTDAIVFSWPVP